MLSLPCGSSKAEFGSSFPEGEKLFIKRSIIFNTASLLSVANNSLSFCVPAL